MVDQKPFLPEHRHCVVCGKPIPLNHETCSVQCERIIAEQRRRQRTTYWIMMGLFLVLVVWFIVITRLS